MRLMNKGGAPCDRQIDRRKVTIAAAALLVLSVASVKANSVTYQVVPSLTDSFGTFRSHLDTTGTGFQFADANGNPTGPFLANSPQKAAGTVAGQTTNSLDAPIVGQVFVNQDGTSFQLLPGSDISVRNTGNYAPGLDNQSNPTLTNPPNMPSQWGAKNAGAGVAAQNQVNTHYDVNNAATYPGPNDKASPPLGAGNGTGTAGSGVYVQPTYTPDINGNFTFSGNQLIQTSGFANGVSATGNFHSDFSGTIVRTDSGTGGAQQGHFDAALSALILPVNFSITFPIISGGHILAFSTSVLTGTIILEPVVPEPSTIVLFGFGVMALLSYGWRARKRKALAG